MPPVHLASALCEIYLPKVLVTHEKLSRWCIYSAHALTQYRQESKGAWGPIVSSFLPSPPYPLSSLYASPPHLPVLLCVLSLCLPISGHGRLLFHDFKQI